MQTPRQNVWWRRTADGHCLTLTLHIQPNAKRTEVVGLHGDAMKIRLAAPPLEGAANTALVEFIAGVFGVPQRQVALKQGSKSRRKVIEIAYPARGPEALFQPAENPGHFRGA
jgi:uncharacterized protein (TIGR00251 family)